MNAQENQALQSFLTQLTQANAGAKDPQAETMIAEAVAKQPDAAYLLVQRAMLLDQALASAKAQIASLQNQLQAAQGARSNSFLDAPNTWGHSAPAQPMQPAPVMAPTPAQVPSQPIPASRPSFFSSGLGGTLGNIATTAAGVAGGAFLFQGIENLFHHNSGGGFFSQPAMGALPTENVVVNNYYEDSPVGDGGNYDTSGNQFMDDSSADDSYGDDPSII